MLLGIKATVDFAFKKIFASHDDSLPLIGLLNAVLRLVHPIVEVKLANPFSYKDFESQKEIILDIRARDSHGRWLNVEMQVVAYPGLLERLVYYVCKMFVDQMSTGEKYVKLRPAISICLVDKIVFSDTIQAHHRFEMIDREGGRKLENSVEVHLIELTKYNVDEASLGTADELSKWVFFLRNAQEYSADKLRELLPRPEFQEAIQTIESIAQKLRIDRCMTSVKKPYATTTGPCGELVKRDVKRDAKKDVKKDVKKAWS